MTADVNRQWLLDNRPPGAPSESDFKLVESPLPEPGDGELLCRVIYLSVDPYMRGRMRDVKSYAAPVAIGAVMEGGTVAQVIESNNPDFAVGDIVESRLGWQEYAVSDGRGLRKVDPAIAPISTAVGVLGMPGMTAFFGLLDVGRPTEGETVLVTAASGAVGGLVGQIAKIKGCRAVGIAGGTAKCGYIVDELGFDAAVDYKAVGDLQGAVAAACPGGVDVIFENVGGRIFDSIMPLINVHARIAICGMISEYNLTEAELAPRPTRHLLVNRARMEGFIVTDFIKRYPEGLKAMAAWLAEGRIKYREDILDGFENAPKALLRLFSGENFGKQLVRVSADPTV